MSYFSSSVINLSLGENVQAIENGFTDFNNLETITVFNSTPPYFRTTNPFTNKQYINLKVFVPSEALQKYQSASVWNNFWNLQGIDVTAINEVKSDEHLGGKAYNLQGQPVGGDYKGIVICDGKKILKR